MPALELSVALYAGQVCQSLAQASSHIGADDEAVLNECGQGFSAEELLARGIVSNDGVLVQVVHILWCVELFAAGRDAEAARELSVARHYVFTMETEWVTVVAALWQAIEKVQGRHGMHNAISGCEKGGHRQAIDTRGFVTDGDSPPWLVTMVQRVADARTIDKQKCDNVQDWHRTLSHRECQVMEQLSRDLTNREIAQELFLSVRTVEAHVLRIRRKLEVRKRRDLARIAREIGAIGL
ncbi:helix-turn-helix transcriptional regulator [Jonesia quinghaiensis]|uniref:helix-turn-helix transcriptional regulator n=1 Tax=Jonesia quinghaiensis TaxID=262806 RepID=UPI00049007EE|nr:helix-turn-helix transcriptional regulator [Jonesia quinghaiensis]